MKAIRYISNPNTAPGEALETQFTTPLKITGTIPYDPAAVFFLELMISITIQNRDRIQLLWYVVE